MTQGVVPPPPSLPPLQVAGVTAYGTTGGATSIPPAIAVLPAGALLRGTIVSRTPLGQFILKTDKGDLALKTDVTFKRGAELVIRMEKAQNETLARIISVDGKSFAKYVESLSQQLPPEDSIAENAFTRQQAALPPKAEIPLPGKPVIPQPVLPTGASLVSARMTAIMLSALPAGSDALKSLPPQVAQMLVQTVAGTQLAVKITQIVLPTAIAPTTNTVQPQPAASIPMPPAPAASLPLSEAPTPTPMPAPMAAMPLPPVATPILPQTVAPQAPAIIAPASAAIPAPAAMPSSPEPLPSPAPAAPSGVTTGAPVTTNAAMPLLTSPSVPLAPPPAVTTTVTVAIPAPAAVPASMQQQPAMPVPPAPAAGTTASLTSAAPDSASPAPVPASAVMVSPTPVSTSASQAAAQTLAATTASLPLSEDTAKPLSVPTQAAQPAPILQAAARAVITATVLEGSATTGLTLHSPLGALRLLSPNPLPPGTQVHFEIEYHQPPTALPSSFPGTALPAKSSAVLEELQQLLLPTAAPATSMEAPAPFAAHLIPRPGKEMTTELVFLMSALKGGDIRKWLGEDHIRRLESKDAELLKQVSAEFSAMRTRIGDEAAPATTRWTMYQLPIATQAGLAEPIRFYHREQGEREANREEKKSESGQHFIVDIQFTRLGRLQLDGFVKKEKGAKQRFDLIIRSEHQLEAGMKQGIREIFEHSGELTGYEGAVSFQEGRDTLFALPLPGAPGAGEGGGESIMV